MAGTAITNAAASRVPMIHFDRAIFHERTMTRLL
jgi:hypothetical protein